MRGRVVQLLCNAGLSGATSGARLRVRVLGSNPFCWAAATEWHTLARKLCHTPLVLNMGQACLAMTHIGSCPPASVEWVQPPLAGPPCRPQSVPSPGSMYRIVTLHTH